MSEAAIFFALTDAREDILTLARLLCEAGYPRRGTKEQTRDIYDFAERVQSLITHEESVNLPSANDKISGGRPRPFAESPGSASGEERKP